MAYFRTTTNKHGAKTTKLIMTAHDRALQDQRRLNRMGVPAWRHTLQNRRANWQNVFFASDKEIQDQYQGQIAELMAFRQRYYANLAYKHKGIFPPAVFRVSGSLAHIFNHCFTDLDLDRWAIENANERLRTIKRTARKYGIPLESDYA